MQMYEHIYFVSVSVFRPKAKILDFCTLHLCFTTLMGWPWPHRDLWMRFNSETIRIIGYDERSMLCLAVSTQYWRVTDDRRTDGRTTCYTATVYSAQRRAVKTVAHDNSLIYVYQYKYPPGVSITNSLCIGPYWRHTRHSECENTGTNNQLSARRTLQIRNKPKTATKANIFSSQCNSIFARNDRLCLPHEGL